MFLLSNFMLKQTGSIKSSSAIATYSIAIGLVIYAALYLYVLFYHQEKLAMFNTILIYVVSIDLLLSSAVYNKEMTDKSESESESESEMESNLNVDTDNELLSEEDELVASDESTDNEDEEEEIEIESINEENGDHLIQESQFMIPTEVINSINVN